MYVQNTIYVCGEVSVYNAQYKNKKYLNVN